MYWVSSLLAVLLLHFSVFMQQGKCTHICTVEIHIEYTPNCSMHTLTQWCFPIKVLRQASSALCPLAPCRCTVFAERESYESSPGCLMSPHLKEQFSKFCSEKTFFKSILLPMIAKYSNYSYSGSSVFCLGYFYSVGFMALKADSINRTQHWYKSK